MPDLVSLTCPSLQILDKTQMGVFSISPCMGQNLDSAISNFWISGQILINKSYTETSYRNSRTSNDSHMRLGPVTKIDKSNTTTLKILTVTFCQQIMMSLPFFQFMASVEQCGCQILDTWFPKFSLITTFYQTKTENKTKNSLTQLS